MDGVMHPSVEQAIGRDRIRKALERYENKPSVSFENGIVRTVNSDGSYEVLLDGDVQPRTCSAYATAGVGDRVLVCIMTNGRCVAVSRLEGETAEFKKPVTVYENLRAYRIILPNSRGFCSETPDGERRSLAYIGSSGNTVFGYDSYAEEEGSTYYYGNVVRITSKDGVYIDGNLVDDSVVASGASGDWLFLKFASGLAICKYAPETAPITSITQAVGSLYRSASVDASLPFPMYEVASFGSFPGNLYELRAYTVSTDTLRLVAFHTSSISSTTANLRAVVIGRWK